MATDVRLTFVRVTHNTGASGTVADSADSNAVSAAMASSGINKANLHSITRIEDDGQLHANDQHDHVYMLIWA